MKPYDDSRPKGTQIEAMFDGIAPVYDRLNDIMSFGIARRWRRAVVGAVARLRANGRILDLATGTGDLAIALARRLTESCVTGADPSEGMLAVARSKAARRMDYYALAEGGDEPICQVSRNAREMHRREAAERLRFVRAEAERLPFGDGVFNVVTASFGVRNFHDIPRGLSEMHRVLDSGGSLFVLEFSTPRGHIFGALYHFYFHRVLPRIGALLSKDRCAYSYLPGSVDEFPAPAHFVEMLRQAGFTDVEARPLTGGVAYIYKGMKK